MLIYSGNIKVHKHRVGMLLNNLLPAVRIEPSTCTLEVAKSGALTYYAMGAKVDVEQDPLNVTVGPHGLRERKERGDFWTGGAQHMTK